MNQVRQKINIAFNQGRNPIILDKYWSLPFSICVYNLYKCEFGIHFRYDVLEITVFKLNILIFKLREL
jgi:hypothetical protein